MDDQQRERFQSAVDRKKEASKAASERTAGAEATGDGAVRGDEAELVEHGRPQDTRDARKKNAGHGKKTADKWNQ